MTISFAVVLEEQRVYDIRAVNQTDTHEIVQRDKELR